MPEPHDWNAGDPPLGTGDMTVLLHGLHVLSAPEDECGYRCSHGGVCTLTEGHTGQHDADGHCQWGTA
ncbi:hypothetical protein LCGC14_1248870 [marine sediment metagenome]|uniref:Uncharacterized protein n=1 Tax=marine sediment metagenome TaxID=412755 RepID=A0A0F9NKY5_9ZZZZ